MSNSLEKYLSNVRKFIKLPLTLGFGISSRKHIETALKYADITVIGSKILNIYNESGEDEKLNNIQEFLKSREIYPSRIQNINIPTKKIFISL